MWQGLTSHRYDLQRVCGIWKAALPATPASWDDGLDGQLLCPGVRHLFLLFGVADHPNLAQGEGPLWEANLSFSVRSASFLRSSRCDNQRERLLSRHRQAPL
jgi:hypothetical protein